MNNCILMAEIIQAPQLRYTADNQTPIAEFVVKFPGLREGDATGQIKVLGWGNLAQEIQGRYREGDRVLLEGRLGMNTVERPEGFKEKRAEMTVQRVNPIGELQSVVIAEPTPMAPGQFVGSDPQPASAPSAAGPAAIPSVPPQTTPQASPTQAATATAPEADAPDYDDIPF